VLAGAFHLRFNWRARGIEASAGTRIKDLAERLGNRPHDLVEILAGA